MTFTLDREKRAKKIRNSSGKSAETEKIWPDEAGCQNFKERFLGSNREGRMDEDMFSLEQARRRL